MRILILTAVLLCLACHAALADCGSLIYISAMGTDNTTTTYDPPVNSSSSLPDFVIRKIWLSDSHDNPKDVFAPGESMRIHIEVKNVGTDTPSGIDVDYFMSNGLKKDSNPTNVGTDFIHKDDLQGGHTHNEQKNTTAPTSEGTYNMTAQADSGHDVDEVHESNNWSKEAVFSVSNSAASSSAQSLTGKAATNSILRRLLLK